MMKDLYIKNKRILLFDFDGTLVETISGGLYAKDLTDMKIKQDVVNRALDLMEQNGVKYFGIISNQCDVKIRRGKSLRDAAVMGIMKWRLYEELKSKYDNISMTFGYVTKYNRINHDIEKSHVSDAFVISKNFNAIRLGYYYKVRLVRRHNRQIHKQKIQKEG